MLIEFLNELTQGGYRIFSVEDAVSLGESLNYNRQSVHYLLRSLVQKNLIRPLYRGCYAIEDNILSGSPLHKFEIAMHLSRGGAVGCWSAMAFHELTDQVLSKVFVFAPMPKGKKRSDYQYKIDGYTFRLIQVESTELWGIERRYVGDVKINITDLERTLLDGLTYPKYCGGFREVLSAFSISLDKLDINKICTYAQKTPISVQKRVGWVLESLGIIDIEKHIPLSLENYYDKLDPLGPRRGKYNKKWMVLENF
jgi:predicted transcriptional regulator of viral defense system